MSTTQRSKMVRENQVEPYVYGVHEGSQAERKYGRCLLCSRRLYSSDSYVTTEQGYCCGDCLEAIRGGSE